MSTYKGLSWTLAGEFIMGFHSEHEELWARPEYAYLEVSHVVAWLNGNDRPLTDMVSPELDRARHLWPLKVWSCSGPCCRQKRV